MNTQHSEIRLNTRAVIVEQNYEMTLSSNLPIKDVKLEGINMNMGIIPVVVEAQNKVGSSGQFIYKGNVFLGMCSEPEMQWMIKVTFENGKTESAIFNSYWQAPEQ